MKLLDFGLAKFAVPAAGGGPDDATLTMALTGSNQILGTLYYNVAGAVAGAGHGPGGR